MHAQGFRSLTLPVYKGDVRILNGSAVCFFRLIVGVSVNSGSRALPVFDQRAADVCNSCKLIAAEIHNFFFLHQTVYLWA